MSDKVYAHFIGVGGAGMSGIARVLHGRGIHVTGSDLRESRFTRALQAEGIPVAIGHTAENLGDPEVVVVSTAIPETNPEVIAAREKGIEIWHRAQMLSKLAGDAKTVAVAGTHGKTSSSSMFATMLEKMGEDPTFLIGGEVGGYQTNAQSGKGSHFVIEADESDKSFLYLDPVITIVTNLEADHLDHYEDFAEIEAIFGEFIGKTPDDGAVIVCGDDENLVRIARESSSAPVITYGFNESCDVVCHVTGREGIAFTAEATMPNGATVTYKINLPGTHMILNGAGVLAGAYALGLDMEKATRALSEFEGVRRRFTMVGEIDGITIVDDYAHHPTEVAATIKAANSLDYNRIHVLFQPHRYSRTQAFKADFGKAFDDADMVTFMDVYSAGEAPIPGVSGKTLVHSVLRHDSHSAVGWMQHRAEVVDFLSSRVRSGDLLITMGAGDVTAMGPLLLERLTEDFEKREAKAATQAGA